MRTHQIVSANVRVEGWQESFPNASAGVVSVADLKIELIAMCHNPNPALDLVE